MSRRDDAPSAAAAAAFSSSDEPRHLFQHHPLGWPPPSSPSDDGALSEGLVTDLAVAVGCGFGARGARAARRLAFGSTGGGIDVAGSNWMRRVLPRAAHPRGTQERRGMLSPLSLRTHRRELWSCVPQGPRGGGRVFLDYGPRSNAELLTTWLLPRSPRHLLSLEPTPRTRPRP